MRPVLLLQTFPQNPKNEQWDHAGIDEDSYFAIAFSWQIFGNRQKKGVATLSRRWRLWLFCVCVWVFGEFARETVMETLLCQPGKQWHSYFWTLEPLLSHGRRQSEHLHFGHNEIFYIWQSFMRGFFTLWNSYLLLLLNSVYLLQA